MSGFSSSVTPIWPSEQLCLTAQEREQALDAVNAAFASTLESLKVDIGLNDMFRNLYVPLGAWVAQRARQQTGPLVLGINGAQGAGKSTMFNLLEIILNEGFGLKVVGFSLDDIYKTRAQRIELSQKVHPLLQTRGVPGTHDVELGLEVLHSLVASDDTTVTKIPVFDKSIDDRCPPEVWQEWVGPADVIVFEGWCVGALAQSEEVLQAPINALERDEDSSGEWRRYVNDQLKNEYKALFEMVDVLLMLKVPSMDSVFEWRSLQEKKLAERVKYFSDTQQPTEHLRIMNAQEINHFIEHYERLTSAMLDEMPNRADVTLHLNANHKIYKIDINQPMAQTKP
ncbi:MAG: hypothetical protein ACPGMR_08535 [Pontibacterium sp.]